MKTANKFKFLVWTLIWGMTQSLWAYELDSLAKIRIARDQAQLEDILVQNEWNDAHGLSANNQYVFGNLDWIEYPDGFMKGEIATALNDQLITYNNKTQNEVKLYLYLGGFNALVIDDKQENYNDFDEYLDAVRSREDFKAEATLMVDRENAILGQIINNDLWNNSTYRMVVGISAYLSVNTPNYDYEKQTFIRAIYNSKPNTSLAEADPALKVVLRDKMGLGIDYLFVGNSPNERIQNRGQGIQNIVDLCLEVLNEYSTDNPVQMLMSDHDVDFSHFAFSVEVSAEEAAAWENAFEEEAESRLFGGEVITYNYAGIDNLDQVLFGLRPENSTSPLLNSYLKKMVIITTNPQTPQSVMDDILQGEGDFSQAGTKKQILWIHYDEQGNRHIRIWHSPDVEEVLSQHDFDELLKLLLREGYSNLAELSKLTGQLLTGFAGLVGKFEILETYWNPCHPDYQEALKAVDWTLQFSNPINLFVPDNEITCVESTTLVPFYVAFAHYAGMHNGLLSEIKDIPALLGAMLEMFGDAEKARRFKEQLDQIDNLGWSGMVSTLFTQGQGYYGTQGTLYKVQYTAGQIQAFVATLFIGVGEAVALVRGTRTIADVTATVNGTLKLMRTIAELPKLAFFKIVKKSGESVQLIKYNDIVIAEIKMVDGKQVVEVKTDLNAVTVVKADEYELLEDGLTIHYQGKDYEGGCYVEKDPDGTQDDIIFLDKDGQPLCFPAGTLVWKGHCQTGIEHIQRGDTVTAYNEETQAYELKVVTNVFVREATELINLYANGKLLCQPTPSHPFYVRGKYIPAEELNLGDTLLTKSGELLILDSLVRIDTTLTVYNFEVEGLHNYLVGESGIVVHNASYGDFDDITKKIANDNNISEAQLGDFVNTKQAEEPNFKLDPDDWNNIKSDFDKFLDDEATKLLNNTDAIDKIKALETSQKSHLLSDLKGNPDLIKAFDDESALVSAWGLISSEPTLRIIPEDLKKIDELSNLMGFNQKMLDYFKFAFNNAAEKTAKRKGWLRNHIKPHKTHSNMFGKYDGDEISQTLDIMALKGYDFSFYVDKAKGIEGFLFKTGKEPLPISLKKLPTGNPNQVFEEISDVQNKIDKYVSEYQGAVKIKSEETPTNNPNTFLYIEMESLGTKPILDILQNYPNSLPSADIFAEVIIKGNDQKSIIIIGNNITVK